MDATTTELVAIVLVLLTAVGLVIGGVVCQDMQSNCHVGPTTDLISRYAIKSGDPEFTLYPQPDGTCLALSVDLR